MTPFAYGYSAVASSRPSAQSTSAARPDSVPKSTPTTYRGLVTSGRLPLWFYDHLQRAPLAEGRKGVRPLREREPLADERSELDAPLLDEPDRPRQIARLHAAADADREFLAARDRRGEGGAVVRRDADEDELAARTQRVDRSCDRVVVAGRLERDVDAVPGDERSEHVTAQPPRLHCDLRAKACAARTRCASGSVAATTSAPEARRSCTSRSPSG